MLLRSGAIPLDHYHRCLCESDIWQPPLDVMVERIRNAGEVMDDTETAADRGSGEKKKS